MPLDVEQELAKLAQRLALVERVHSAGQIGPILATNRDGARIERMAREALRERALRSHYLRSDYFGEPAWDMLLELTAARVALKPISVSSLCIASNVPPTTALRWIGKLESEGAVVRRPDPRDGVISADRLKKAAAERLRPAANDRSRGKCLETPLEFFWKDRSLAIWHDNKSLVL